MTKLFTFCGVALLSAVTCVSANPTKGPWGALVPSPDPARYYEFICDNAPGPLSIYIVYDSPYDAEGVEFWAPKPSCFTATYLSDTRPFEVTVGNSQAGVSILFDSCRQSPVHVLTINYLAYGTTPADCQYRTLPNPYTGGIWLWDCAGNAVSLGNGGNFINPPEGDCEPVPVESSTWGNIKSLYSD